MDVFRLRDSLIHDYSNYIESFIEISDSSISERVSEELNSGALWPDPLIQLNPNFEPGEWIDSLVERGSLHALASRIFRLGKDDGPSSSKPMRLHRHQSDAIEAARSGDNYVLTTGTGSGKSLAYMVPIVDHVLRRGSGKGIQAIIIYPMNALANSQLNELDKFLAEGFDRPPVTYRRYTGQEDDQQRQEIIDNPPDIILTNYVMLELMMTRPKERRLVESMQSLQFLVLDELHTYRGRQGADVAMLVRRVRDLSKNANLQCIGTSATLAEGGTFAEQQVKIAEVATQLFGATVKPERVIGETLIRATPDQDISTDEFTAQLRQRLTSNEKPSSDHGKFISDPLSVWIETTFGLETEEKSGRLKRAVPKSITGDEGAAAKLAELTGLDLKLCADAIKACLLAGYDVPQNAPFPVFAFRLHQFISRGDTVYASLEDKDERYITLNGQQFVPGHRDKKLYPISFCRECGQEYYTVSRAIDSETGRAVYLPRDIGDHRKEENIEKGFLYRNPDNEWPEDVDQQIEENRLPDDWLEVASTSVRVKRHYRGMLPERTVVDPSGEETVGPEGLGYHFVRAPFRFCMNCGVTYGGRERSDFGKLSTLSSEGRSTATTILSLSTIRALREEDLKETARKLLSFTDNRQDASLQAGHFNDFVEVGLIRAALYKAVSDAGEQGIEHDKIALSVFNAMDLPFDQYSVSPEVTGRSRRRRIDEAFRDVLGYRVYQDLRRGWRITSPNLEQCGLLRIEYIDLEDICADEEVWAETHPALVNATMEERLFVCQTLLDLLRRGLAIKVTYLDPLDQDSLQQNSGQNLVSPWAIDESERRNLVHSVIALPGPRSQRSKPEGYLPVSARGGFGMLLRRPSTFTNNTDTALKLDDSEIIIKQLFEILTHEGLVDCVEDPQGDDSIAGYQLMADCMVWLPGDGQTPFHDPIRMPSLPKAELQKSRTNAFFVNFYKEIAGSLQGVKAKEHTAQVPSDEREKREHAFRDATLPILFCSPTMELGVDISQLNVVNMRNVPPTPANYAQRSGRAGRSGQPALVFTYCTTGSPHDQYFFKRPSQMVAGAVRPPRLDLGNEDLIRSHVHSVWLAETGQTLFDSLKNLLELDGDPPSLAIEESVLASLEAEAPRRHAEERLVRILGNLKDILTDTEWYTEDWIKQTLTQAVRRFNEACERWRGLYQSALMQVDRQNQIVLNAAATKRDKDQAKRLRAEAESQLSLLLDVRSAAYSDFYSYRYFASEGFLPGYNFPRLPLSAYIPARRGRQNKEHDEFLSRPRFLAIKEFGPRSIIYHEGSRYQINKAILPVTSNDVLTTTAKVCEVCGYLHPVNDQSDPELCEYCGEMLPNPMRSLFRMRNVATTRRDRINSDEEERFRLGYDLQTSVRFADSDGNMNCRTAIVHASDGQQMLKMVYGSAATIWRVNKGWRHRRSKEVLGFVLDIERGYWKKSETEDDDDADDPMSPRTKRVVPFVEDRRNCLLLEFNERHEVEVMASLQPAIKTAIQVLYQLEDNELAAEPLPSVEDRRYLLFYESSEGGAGVLKQLVSDKQAMHLVARKALEICHYDPETGEDLHRAEGAKEDCEAACYNCLMSYYNQPDHALLDRKLVLEPLMELSTATVNLSPTALEPDAQLDILKRQCDSDLEKEWLDTLVQQKLRLPDEAQKEISDCGTRCDFYYSDHMVVIFIDGTPHDRAGAGARDQKITNCLELDMGLTVLRFRYDQKEQWDRIFDENAYVFGQVRE